MTTKIIFASNKLGPITNDQLQSMLDRWKLGELISSHKTEKGVMQQTLFVTSSQGEYVLKGNPFYEGQFLEEKFFVDRLEEKTSVPVPYPYRVDETEDIFGWSYAIMPRLPGNHLYSTEIQATMKWEDKEKIARLLAHTLAIFHHWRVNEYGEYDPNIGMIRPFKKSYQAWFYDRIRYWLEDAEKYSTITSADIHWVENILENSLSAFKDIGPPAFVMGDFKPENFLLRKTDQQWQISGVFDFTNAYFGDPIADLPKIMIRYLENGQKELAKQFLTTYLAMNKGNYFSKETFLQ